MAFRSKTHSLEKGVLHPGFPPRLLFSIATNLAESSLLFLLEPRFTNEESLDTLRLEDLLCLGNLGEWNAVSNGRLNKTFPQKVKEVHHIVLAKVDILFPTLIDVVSKSL